MSTPTPTLVVVPDEVRPPAYWLAPRVARLRGYLAAPLVLAVAVGIAALVRAAFQ